ncbi:DUF2000 domain-containing protein [Klenkia taihuensis]|uniref:DUF2000 domain-containing protein n=1 Tax=Klenkia taihuensis TaxID=1225127 RepID=A0A1I1H2F4_9ACTN|nr:DUF2000 domain-containing protein [Klenkia taihuensis]GHE09441.1 hypothetical protein GCM10011381_14240 [Klenkia taihuensis]SFC17961.1 Protein of unknown function [Klenkia taihuensis]
MTTHDAPAFTADEVVTAEPTRNARLKWVVVVDAGVPAGEMVNAVACTAAATGAAVDHLLAHGGPDADGAHHPGLPWAGCSVLTAPAHELAAVRAKAVGSPGVLVVDMPRAAQTHRVYDEYLAELAGTAGEDLACRAVSIVGPRNRVAALTKRLGLL